MVAERRGAWRNLLALLCLLVASTGAVSDGMPIGSAAGFGNDGGQVAGAIGIMRVMGGGVKRHRLSVRRVCPFVGQLPDGRQMSS
jgi:hypothetical protein